MEAVARLSDFAKQARNAVSLSPDIALISILPIYSQRGLRALNLDDSGNINLDELNTIVADLKDLGGEIVFGYTPGVVANDKQFKEWLVNSGIDYTSPVAAIKKAIALYKGQ